MILESSDVSIRCYLNVNFQRKQSLKLRIREKRQEKKVFSFELAKKLVFRRIENRLPIFQAFLDK